MRRRVNSRMERPSRSWFRYRRPVSLSARVIDWLSQWMQVRADGVVAVASGRREAAAALVEREREQLGVGSLGFVDAALPRRRSWRRSPMPNAARISMRRVAGVDLQRHVGMTRRAAVEVVDAVVEHAEELEQLGAHLRVGPDADRRRPAASGPWSAPGRPALATSMRSRRRSRSGIDAKRRAALTAARSRR